MPRARCPTRRHARRTGGGRRTHVDDLDSARGWSLRSGRNGHSTLTSDTLTSDTDRPVALHASLWQEWLPPRVFRKAIALGRPAAIYSPYSRAVRALSGLSVLVRFSMNVETSHVGQSPPSIL